VIIMTVHPLSLELSEYLDAELPPDRAAQVERHLAECPACATVYEELRRVVVRAQALDDRPPRQDLWPGVAAAIGAAPSAARRVTLPLPTLLAAGLALMLGSGGGVMLWQRTHQAPPLAVAPPVAAPESIPAMVAAQPAGRGYSEAVRVLEQELAARRGELDTTTVRVLEQNLALIDRAITEAERALAADPADGYLAGHLTQTRLRKLDLLRRAAALSRAQS